jgi:hypothetical protein
MRKRSCAKQWPKTEQKDSPAPNHRENSRSLHYAAPDFLLGVVALIMFMRLSRKKQDPQGLKPRSLLGLDGTTLQVTEKLCLESLRDVRKCPGRQSWVNVSKLNSPVGTAEDRSRGFQPSLTGLVNWIRFTQDWRPGLFSDVPSGLTRSFSASCKVVP